MPPSIEEISQNTFWHRLPDLQTFQKRCTKPSSMSARLPSFALASSPLGVLPPEIRLQIYALVLPPSTIHIWRRSNRLSNSICSCSSNDPLSFGPTGTFNSLIASEAFNQDEVVAEASCTHISCFASRTSNSRERLSTALFRTCKGIHAESHEVVETLYRKSTFHFHLAPALEGFIHNLCPSHQSLLRYIHLTLPTAKSYHGVRQPLTQTLFQLVAGNENIRLRIQFHAYHSNDLEFNWSPTYAGVNDLLRCLPIKFESICVIVPPLRSSIKKGEQIKWYTKLMPPWTNEEYFAKIIMDIMGTRGVTRKVTRENKMVVVQDWPVREEGYMSGVGKERPKEYKEEMVKRTMVFGV
ncbi:MAG: hypothetical protein Q9222_006773 [Ikaeria aurantiellina]